MPQIPRQTAATYRTNCTVKKDKMEGKDPTSPQPRSPLTHKRSQLQAISADILSLSWTNTHSKTHTSFKIDGSLKKTELAIPLPSQMEDLRSYINLPKLPQLQ